MATLRTFTRREVLRLGSIGILAATIGPGCTRRTSYYDTHTKFSKIAVSENRVIRNVAGLRPYRDLGFVVRHERIGSKDIVHNYGHGGAGISLSWGSSQLAMEKALMLNHRECAIIGCGIIGLTAAILMQQKGYKVTIYAKDIPPETTSNDGAGRWSPSLCFNEDQISPEFYNDFLRATSFSYYYFQNYLGDKYGVTWIENYFLSDSPIKQSKTDRDISYSYRNVHKLDRNQQPFHKSYCVVRTMLKIDTMVFLPAIIRDFRSAGGKIVVQEFSDLSQLQALNEPLIMNCTGLGSHHLFGDMDLYPIKGQLVSLLPQDDIDYSTKVVDDELYMIPRSDGIILGGTWEKNNWSLTTDPIQTQRILSGNAKLLG